MHYHYASSLLFSGAYEQREPALTHGIHNLLTLRLLLFCSSVIVHAALTNLMKRFKYLATHTCRTIQSQVMPFGDPPNATQKMTVGTACTASTQIG